MRPCCIAHAHACDYFNPSRVCGHSFSFKRVLPYRQAVIVLVSRHCNRPNWHDSSYRRIGLIAIVFCALVVWANNTRMTFYTQVIGSILCLKWEQEHIPFLGVRLLWRQSSIANCFEGPVHLFNWSATVYVPWLKQGLRLAQYIPHTQNLYNMYAYIYIYICMKDWRYMYVFVCMYVFMPVCIYVCDCIVLSGGHTGRFLLRRDASWNVGGFALLLLFLRLLLLKLVVVYYTLERLRCSGYLHAVAHRRAVYNVGLVNLSVWLSAFCCCFFLCMSSVPLTMMPLSICGPTQASDETLKFHLLSLSVLSLSIPASLPVYVSACQSLFFSLSLSLCLSLSFLAIYWYRSIYVALVFSLLLRLSLCCVCIQSLCLYAVFRVCLSVLVSAYFCLHLSVSRSIARLYLSLAPLVFGNVRRGLVIGTAAALRR